MRRGWGREWMNAHFGWSQDGSIIAWAPQSWMRKPSERNIDVGERSQTQNTFLHTVQYSTCMEKITKTHAQSRKYYSLVSVHCACASYCCPCPAWQCRTFSVCVDWPRGGGARHPSRLPTRPPPRGTSRCSAPDPERTGSWNSCYIEKNGRHRLFWPTHSWAKWHGLWQAKCYLYFICWSDCQTSIS